MSSAETVVEERIIKEKSVITISIHETNEAKKVKETKLVLFVEKIGLVLSEREREEIAYLELLVKCLFGLMFGFMLYSPV